MSDQNIPEWAQNLNPTQKTPMAQPHVMNEFEIEMGRCMDQPRCEISCMLSLVEPRAWMAGLHSDVDGGWHDSRNNTFVSFDTARQWIADRIAELGLDADLVYAYPKSRGGDVQVFWKQTFEQRLIPFRRAA